MAIEIPLREFYDDITEIVGIKSGILLNRFQVSNILLEYFNYDYLKSDNLEMYVKNYSSLFEMMVEKIRKKIGNLPLESPSEKAKQYLREYPLNTSDKFAMALFANSIDTRYFPIYEDISVEELAELIHKDKGYEKELSLALATIAYETYDRSCIIKDSLIWDGGTELSKLYDCELNSENNFLEQKFIDYLAVNGHEIEAIHWRNFERFCAEYFKKQGYIVILSSGTNDGGVDIRAYKDMGSAPDFLIQCKRYKQNRKVNIETVKSFYTDVQFAKAKSGLIATTSYIAPGGRKISETRGYNLKFAEKENIKKWAKEMWTFKK